MNLTLTLTPIRIVLIALVIVSLCFLFQNLMEAYKDRCDHVVDRIQTTCNQTNIDNCLACFTKYTKSACNGQGNPKNEGYM